jgi:hypothetical protein
MEGGFIKDEQRFNRNKVMVMLNAPMRPCIVR